MATFMVFIQFSFIFIFYPKFVHFYRADMIWFERKFHMKQFVFWRDVKVTKFKIQSLVFVLVAFMLGCNEFIVVGILPDLSKQFQTPISTMGYLVTIFAMVYAISTTFVTVLTSR